MRHAALKRQLVRQKYIRTSHSFTQKERRAELIAIHSLIELREAAVISLEYSTMQVELMKNCKSNDMKRQRRKCCTSSLIAALVFTICLMLRGCGAFHLIISERNTRSQLTPLCLSSNNNFAAIMAAEKEASSPSDANFESLIWHDSYDNNKNGNNNNKGMSTAILPDDEVPSNIPTTPIMHNQRTLYYQQSLLSIEEATKLQRTAEQCGNFIKSNGIAGIIERGNVVADESLVSVLTPLLTTKILPWAREVSGTPTLTVADALIRTYDPSTNNNEEEECCSLHLSEHYDESSFATIILPLNDPNDYEGGLYVQSGACASTRRHVPFENAGDAVLHKYDVMHGVHVRSGKERCSLVLWCGEDEMSVKSRTVPWIIRDAKRSVHAAFLFACNCENGWLGFDKDLDVAREYYDWASRRGHARSEYKLWLMEEGAKQQ